jgi:tetratricopeptide (TPR) repeat protein
MDNVLEVNQVKPLRRYARTAGALLFIAAASELGAQSTGTGQTLRPGQTAGPRFLVPILRSSEKTLGVQVGDAIRERMMGDFMATTIYIVPKVDMENQLEASGYSKTEALSPNDLKQLAPIVHAVEYLDGLITRDPSGQLTAKLYLNLVRPPGMVQPLPEFTGAKAGDIAKQVSAEVDKARKQIAPTNTCLTLSRQGKYADAMAAAQKGVAAYSRAVFARVCMLETAYAGKMGPDSIMRIAEEILSIYPENTRALILVTDAYGEKNMEEKFLTSMMNMLKADPTNTQLLERALEELRIRKKWDMAIPLVDAMVAQNPGDVAAIKTQLLIYRGAQRWKRVAEISEEVAKADTAAADTLFYRQLIAVYVNDSQPQKAAETAARATKKFPRNAFFWQSYVQLLRQLGQAPQALEAINKMLTIDPKTPGMNLQKALIFKEQNQIDSVLAAVRAAVAAGDDKATAGTLALGAGQPMLNEWSKDPAKTVQRGEYVLSVLMFADSLNSSDASQFLMGATKLSLGQLILGDAAKEKNCDNAKRGQLYVQDAGTHIQKGGRAFAQQAGQLMQGQMQLIDYADKVVKAVCKKH